MQPIHTQQIEQKILNSTSNTETALNDVISVNECKPYIPESKLTDAQITVIKNNLVGIVDNVINNYLEDFK